MTQVNHKCILPIKTINSFTVKLHHTHLLNLLKMADSDLDLECYMVIDEAPVNGHSGQIGSYDPFFEAIKKESEAAKKIFQ